MTKGTEAALRDGGSEELSAFQLDWQEHAKSSAKWQGGLYTHNSGIGTIRTT